MARSSFLSYYFTMIFFSTQNSLMRFQFGADGVNSDFPGGSDSKDSACNAGDPDSIPGLGRFPGEGSGHPLWYSCLENSMDREFWQVIYSPRGLSPVSSAEYNYQTWIKCMDYIFKDWEVKSHTWIEKKNKNENTVAWVVSFLCFSSGVTLSFDLGKLISGIISMNRKLQEWLKVKTDIWCSLHYM